MPTLGYTVDSFAPAQLALRANLRLAYLAPAPALDCLSLGICAIARVISASLRLPRCSASLRLPPYYGCPPWATHLSLPLDQCAFALVFAPAHVALRAAFGRLPSQRPLACVRSRSVDSQVLPTCSSFGAALRQSLTYIVPDAAPGCPRQSFSLRSIMSPYGLPSAGYPASARWHVFAPG